MTITILLLLTMGTMMMNPISLAIMILLMSLTMTIPLYKASGSSWMTYVLVITFSSGMMTLFMYTASLATNEVNKTKKNKLLMSIMMTTIVLPTTQQKKIQSSMKFFSKYTIMMAMATILIITLVAMISHGHSPHQTLNSSF